MIAGLLTHSLCKGSDPLAFGLGTGRLHTWHVVKRPRGLIMAAENKEQELRDKRQELREIKEELRADEATRGDKQALRERRNRCVRRWTG
jgi:microcompartment protein CcmL/EutN